MKLKLQQIIRDAVEKQRLADQGNMTKMKESTRHGTRGNSITSFTAEAVFREERVKLDQGKATFRLEN